MYVLTLCCEASPVYEFESQNFFPLPVFILFWVFTIETGVNNKVFCNSICKALFKCQSGVEVVKLRAQICVFGHHLSQF